MLSLVTVTSTSASREDVLRSSAPRCAQHFCPFPQYKKKLALERSTARLLYRTTTNSIRIGRERLSSNSLSHLDNKTTTSGPTFMNTHMRGVLMCQIFSEFAERLQPIPSDRLRRRHRVINSHIGCDRAVRKSNENSGLNTEGGGLFLP